MASAIRSEALLKAHPEVSLQMLDASQASNRLRRQFSISAGKANEFRLLQQRFSLP
jgi:hypothetical protein